MMHLGGSDGRLKRVHVTQPDFPAVQVGASRTYGHIQASENWHISCWIPKVYNLQLDLDTTFCIAKFRSRLILHYISLSKAEYAVCSCLCLCYVYLMLFRQEGRVGDEIYALGPKLNRLPALSAPFTTDV